MCIFVGEKVKNMSERVTLQHQNILCTSDLNLYGTEVTGGWAREINTVIIIDDEW